MTPQREAYWRARIIEAASAKDTLMFQKWLQTILPRPGSGREVYIPTNGSQSVYTHYDPEVEEVFQ